MIIAEVRCANLSDWRGQLRDTETGQAVGEEFCAVQRGALIGLMAKWIPLTHLTFRDVGAPPTD